MSEVEALKKLVDCMEMCHKNQQQQHEFNQAVIEKFAVVEERLRKGSIDVNGAQDIT